MGELMRFRQARSAQRRIPAANSLVNLGTVYEVVPETVNKLRGLLTAASAKSSASNAYLKIFKSAAALRQYVISASGPATGLYSLDEWLASFGLQADQTLQPSIADLKAKVALYLGAYLPPNSTTDWQALHKTLAELYYAVLASNSLNPSPLLVDLQTALTRLLLVVALVDSLIQTSSSILTTADVWNALRWRTLVLPDPITTLLQDIRAQKGSVLARKPGFADLYITREEWDHYEAAEIASIENILGGELKSHVHVLVNEMKTTTATDISKTTTDSQDTTTTDLTQLQQQSSSDVSLAAHVDASVNTSGQYGPTKVDTHIGGSLDYSNANANSKAATQSHETVSRAVNSVVQSTRIVRSVSTLSRDVNKEIHKFDNTKQVTPIVGVYRWVDQIQNVELDRYPHRFLMEFEIPEPGAWTRWLHWNDATRNMINQLPPPFLNDQNKPLQPGDLTPNTYQKYVARYDAAGVSPPPGPQYISTSIKRDMPTTEYHTQNPDWKNQPVFVVNDTSAAVPSGYVALTWTASIEAWTWGSGSQFMDIAVGSGVHQSVASLAPGGSIQANASGSVQSGTSLGISVGNVPVTVMTLNVWGFVVNVLIECDPLPETLLAWQASTFDQLVAAYNTLLQAYNNEKAGLDVSLTNLADAGSPEQNAKSITQELKRQVIEMLIGAPFSGTQNAISWDDTGVVAPTTDLGVAAATALEVQFLEQAFEWETLSYICYPYYWADSTRWKELALIQGSDQNFADFLRSGSARVILAARPGFEDQVNLYTSLGILWGGGPAPAPGDPDYLSIADEIKAQQQRPLDVSVIDSWQVRLPTTLIWLENPDGLPVNPSPTIIPKPDIISISPSSGAAGTAVTILGACFGAAQGTSTVSFNGTAATPTQWGRTSIAVTVPASASSGNVVVTVSGIDSNSAAFTVT